MMKIFFEINQTQIIILLCNNPLNKYNTMK